MKKQRAVLTVTTPVSTLKRAFRKLYPDKTAQELLPLWLKFWGGIAQKQSTKLGYMKAAESVPASPVDAEEPLDPQLLATALKDLEIAKLEREGDA